MSFQSLKMDTVFVFFFTLVINSAIQRFKIKSKEYKIGNADFSQISKSLNLSEKIKDDGPNSLCADISHSVKEWSSRTLNS